MTTMRTRFRIRLPVLAGWVLWVAAMSGCVEFKARHYSARPERIANPRSEILQFVRTNVSPGCLSVPRFQGRTLDVQFVCNQGVGHLLARLDRVKSVRVEEAEGGWYRVVLHHSDETEDFVWSSRNLKDVERAADAFSALSVPAQRKAPRSGANI